MTTLLTDEARRLLRLERQLRGAGIPAGRYEASLATFKRDLSRLLSELGAVIVWQGDRYCLVNRDWPGVMPHVFDEAAR